MDSLDPRIYWPGGPLCPWLTADLPGIGGWITADVDDFIVDEVPAYAPSGEGDHWFVRIRKRDCTTDAARRVLARAVDIDPCDVGVAGQKDKRAITTQWMSIPVEPRALEDDRIELLEQVRHPHKLRMGHVAANRFHIRLRGLDPAAAERLPALEAQLAGGHPNYFGPQRFSGDGHTLAAARRFVAGGRPPRGNARFALSALQSAAFNAWLGARLVDGLFDRAVDGDVMKKRATGGLFHCERSDEDEPRVAAGEIDPTGPMPGPRCLAALSTAAEREIAGCIAAGYEPDDIKRMRRLAPGTRRVARIIAEDVTLAIEGDCLDARFTLPAGAYATVFLGELAHPGIANRSRV